jgi:hypothetical protein
MSQFPFFSQQQPTYRGQAGQAQKQQQQGFFDSLFSGFGLFGGQAPSYRGKVSGQLPPAIILKPFSAEMVCPEMDKDTIFSLGQPVTVPWPKGARAYRVSFSPAYVAALQLYPMMMEQEEAKAEKYPGHGRPRAIAAFPVGMTEPAHGAVKAGFPEPTELRITPHWFSAVGVPIHAESIRAVLTVHFE